MMKGLLAAGGLGVDNSTELWVPGQVLYGLGGMDRRTDKQAIKISYQ